MAAKTGQYTNEMKVERKFMRTGGYTCLDYKNNSDKMKKLNTQPIMEFTENYTSNWENVLQIPQSKIPLKVVHYQPKNKDLWGRPLKHCNGTVTGQQA
jgi:hypothetical protein